MAAVDPVREQLVWWFKSCDFAAYSTDALNAAYDALVGDYEPSPDACEFCGVAADEFGCRCADIDRAIDDAKERDR
jgi:hypothetical protein